MVQSLERAIRLLEILKTSRRGAALSQLSEKVDLAPSTTHRIMQTLCANGYAVRDERTHLYSLGPALIGLGSAAAAGLDLNRVATPVLQRLSQACREDSFLIILSGERGLVLAHEDGPRNLKIVEKIGQEVELHCGAIRKSILAYQDDAFLEAYLQHCAEYAPEHPIEDPEALRRELAQIRRDGAAMTVGDYIADAVGIGAPVFDASGRVTAGLGIVMPTARVVGGAGETAKAIVKTHAEELSRRLGYSPAFL